MARWLIRITGKQRRQVDVDSVVQAVIALGHQMAEEDQAVGGGAKPDTAASRSAAPVAAIGEVAS